MTQKTWDVVHGQSYQPSLDYGIDIVERILQTKETLEETRISTFRVCKAGPWLVVYPDRIWYGKLDVTKLRRILKEHVEEGRPVREWIATKMPNLAKDS